ncbi:MULTISPECIES: 2,3-diaminopropionate biosynthesis protein SbnB [Micromonospora]|uniref:Ornithine cyclodeaminase n=1 Tax=Micromonospora haikouensis TaxID=686309 RepID=A0A0D0X1A8_9ACTN|nr:MULTISPECIES: 2,3-diaminopropionate biosynthesis protein SbnB [Micromonospora]KIR64926.1 hypothetical protein TK50_05035 [Micromonospora haikouensis]
MSSFHLVPGAVVADVLARSRPLVLQTVADAYVAHETGATTLGPSAFLRFPERHARIIALSAHVRVPTQRVGMKWISSFPENLARGEKRASAVIVLNDHETGRPVACLEGARISAARTGAAAAVAARAVLGAGATERPRRVGFVGCGPIASSVLEYLLQTPIEVGEIHCHDADSATADAMVGQARRLVAAPARRVGKAEALDADVVVLATNALRPHIGPETTLRPGQVVLNISLRDLAPEVILDAQNVVDDVAHCLQADTSPHLAEQQAGSRGFISATIGQLLLGEAELDDRRPVVVSPFGLGVLDVAVAGTVLDRVLAEGAGLAVDDFLGDVRNER